MKTINQSLSKHLSQILLSALLTKSYKIQNIPRTFASVCNNRKKQNLLKYPALKLDETMPKFLKSIQPLLSDSEYEETEQVAQEFVCNEGARLQELLEKTAQCEENWLAHRWLKFAYLANRMPVTIYSSPGMSFPIMKFKNPDEYYDYTSKLIMGLVKFKRQVDESLIPIVKMGKLELDNSQFGAVYGTCRIPLKDEDDIEYNPNSQHVVIIYKNHFYKLPVYNKQDRIINAKVLAEQLKRIADTEKSYGLPLGILSTDQRDNWAQSYLELSKCGNNCQSLKCIHSALFTVSLDQCVDFTDADKYNILSHQLIHGGGSKQNSANRWMDKTIQVIVNPNGMSGFCYEHSPAEGQPIALMTEYLTKILTKQSEFEDGSSEHYDCASKLEFAEPTDCLKDKINKAMENVDKLIDNFHVQVAHYQCYGKEFLKQQKLSPDSFIQMALQYAFYKHHKCIAAQYESAHLRIYYGGRTETIRSCSNESLAFARSMLNPSANDQIRVDLLKEAVNGHRQYTNMALQGRGVDRHLLGLKLMALENKLPLPKFYSSPGYVKSSHFRISTSQVATKNLAFMSYGPSTDDGYACCYNPRDNDIFLAVSSWRSNNETCSEKYAKSIEEALTKMHDILLKTQNEKGKKEMKCKK
ncbi:carnitine O-acetyltransferase-like [Musca domestica]|uniref:Carnitine O-acetyltransferase-like n=1 Tax=Musca domestica TaxID=7370 RepID=A0A9J7CRL9_MUSDO|nr:carnitine O-acetyltransferase-like [Musca domestica]XP_058981198.1 carnitine O-acetyltransferase-like [Musca domestica]